MKNNLIDVIAATWELCGGQKPTEPAMKLMVLKLDTYDPELLLAALGRCMSELKGRISIGDIIDRIDDGHPGPEESWAMMPKGENDSVVWTEEMKTAWFDVLQLQSDPVAARVAFKEVYARKLAQSRSRGSKPRWVVSPGHNRDKRESAVLDAVAKKRLELDWALREYPQIEARLPAELRQQKQLPPPDDCPSPTQIKGLIGKLGRKMGK